MVPECESSNLSVRTRLAVWSMPSVYYQHIASVPRGSFATPKVAGLKARGLRIKVQEETTSFTASRFLTPIT